MLAENHWSTYLTLSETIDKEFIRDMKSASDGILVFTGLFAAVVATFLVQSCALLTPAPLDQSTPMLAEILTAIRSSEKEYHSTLVNTTHTFPSPDIYAVRVNSIWALSLVLSLFSAFMATLVQHWTRRYINMIRTPGSTRDRALLHASLRCGIEQFAMKYSVDLVVVSLHSAVALFVYGLAIYLDAMNPNVAWVVKAFSYFFLAVYTILTLLPIIFPTSPYATPLSEVLRIPLAAAVMLLHSAIMGILLVPKYYMEWCLGRHSPLLPARLYPDTYDFTMDRRTRLMSTLQEPSARRSGIYVQVLVHAFSKDPNVAKLLSFIHQLSDCELGLSGQQVWSCLLQTNFHRELAWFISSLPSKEPMTLETTHALAELSSQLIEHTTEAHDALIPLFDAWASLSHMHMHQSSGMTLVAICQMAKARLRFSNFPLPTDPPIPNSSLAWWKYVDDASIPGPDFEPGLASHNRVQSHLFHIRSLNLPLPTQSESSWPSEFIPPYMRQYTSTLAFLSFIRCILSTIAYGDLSDSPVIDDSLFTCKATLDALAEAVITDIPATASFSRLQLEAQLRILSMRRTTWGRVESGSRIEVTASQGELRASRRWTDLQVVLQRIKDALRAHEEIRAPAPVRPSYQPGIISNTHFQPRMVTV